jgi:hypothetical protein
MDSIENSLSRHDFILSMLENYFLGIIALQDLRGDSERVRKNIDMQHSWLIHSLSIIFKSVRHVGKELWTKNTP